MRSLHSQTLWLREVRSTKPALLSQGGFSSIRQWSSTRNKVHHLAMGRSLLSPGMSETSSDSKPDEASECLVTVIEVRFCQDSKTNKQTNKKNPRRCVCQENCLVFSCLLFSLGFQVVTWGGMSRGEWTTQERDVCGAYTLVQQSWCKQWCELQQC